MVGNITLSGKQYRYVFSVRSAKMYQDLFGVPKQTNDNFEVNEMFIRILFTCLKTSDELRLIDGQEAQFTGGIGELEAIISDSNEKSFAEFILDFSEKTADKSKKKVEAVS